MNCIADQPSSSPSRTVRVRVGRVRACRSCRSGVARTGGSRSDPQGGGARSRAGRSPRACPTAQGSAMRVRERTRHRRVETREAHDPPSSARAWSCAIGCPRSASSPAVVLNALMSPPWPRRQCKDDQQGPSQRHPPGRVEAQKSMRRRGLGRRWYQRRPPSSIDLVLTIRTGKVVVADDPRIPGPGLRGLSRVRHSWLRPASRYPNVNEYALAPGWRKMICTVRWRTASCWRTSPVQAAVANDAVDVHAV
jgi:hypothetical protein